MCQACSAKKKNWAFSNGKRNRLYAHKFYRVYQGHTANVKLCHLCSIDLFMLGESRFLMQNPNLAGQMASERSTFVST